MGASAENIQTYAWFYITSARIVINLIVVNYFLYCVKVFIVSIFGECSSIKK